MFEKIKNLPKNNYLAQLKDVRMLGLIAFAIIVLLVSWSTLGAIQANYVLQKQVSRLEQQNSLQELENTNLKLRNEYYSSDQYLELTARRQFGFAAPGETVFLIPKNVALARTIEVPKRTTDNKSQALPQKPWYQQNFEAWMDFFFHRQG